LIFYVSPRAMAAASISIISDIRCIAIWSALSAAGLNQLRGDMIPLLPVRNVSPRCILVTVAL
jgi:hypothetical protein